MMIWRYLMIIWWWWHIARIISSHKIYGLYGLKHHILEIRGDVTMRDERRTTEDRATQPMEAWGWVSQYVHFEKLMNTQSFPLFSINHCWLFVYLDGRFPRPTFLGCSFPFLENVQTGECNLDPGFHSAPSTHQTWPAPSSASHLPRIVQVWPRGKESGKRDEMCGIRVSLGEAQAVTT